MKILVALSGGVDSSVAATLLAEEGHDLVGVTMKNWCYGAGEEDGRSCCSLESIEAARKVARTIGFPHYVVDFEAPFATHVIRPFVRDYVEGRTPNPCVACNAKVRFPGLWNRARAFGCDAFATGHYARVDRTGARPRVLRPVDRRKDQSYVLWGVPPETLAHLQLPLGELYKSEVRRIAARKRLASAERPDSQEICFVPGGDHGEFLQERLQEEGLPRTLRAGEVVTADGRAVGTHRGVARYTIGQRRGLGVALGAAVYVTGLDPGRNRVIVGPREHLLARHAELRDVRWPDDACRVIDIEVQLRSHHEAARARVERRDGGRARVVFEDPQRAITPGQSAVFYDGDLVLGGGIVRDEPHREAASEGFSARVERGTRLSG